MKSKLIKNLESKLNPSKEEKGNIKNKNLKDCEENFSKMSKNLKSDNETLINKLKKEFEIINQDFQLIPNLDES